MSTNTFSQQNLAAALSTSMPQDAASSAVVLRGTGRGLEVLLGDRATLDQVVAELAARLEASPGFFDGSDVTIRLGGARLPAGALARIEAVTSRFGLRIAEVRGGAIVASTPGAARTAPVSSATPVRANALDPSPGTARMHVGPVRSGVVLEAQGDLVVVGDVNPGAEVRARGNIVVVGALRGLAHAASQGAPSGFIVALRLEAQQLRIGALIARAGDAGGTPRGAEIAFVGGGQQIVVEAYQGRLPVAIATPSAR